MTQDSYLPEVYRAIPHNKDAEMGVLCSMFLDPGQTMETCLELLSLADFHIPAHAVLFQALFDLNSNLMSIDAISVVTSLRKSGKLTQIGGAPFLNSIFEFVPTSANHQYYIKLVKEAAVQRKVIEVCTKAVSAAYDLPESIEALVNGVEQGVLQIGESLAGKSSEFTSARAWSQIGYEAIQDALDKDGPSGLLTGFIDFDDMTDGLHDGEMIVVAARPSMGKTAFAMNIAEHVCCRNTSKGVAVFSMEMSLPQITQRAILSRARVNLKEARARGLKLTDGPAINKAAEELGRCRMMIDDASGLNVMQIAHRLRRMKREGDLSLAIIDYLQIMKPVNKYDSREREVAEMSGALKALAKELKIPILVLCQINRKAEARLTGRPQISDLRESGSIEQDADMICLLHREEYYAATAEEKSKVEGMATVIIGKNRNGPVGDVPLTFLKEYVRFEGRSRERNQ